MSAHSLATFVTRCYSVEQGPTSPQMIDRCGEHARGIDVGKIKELPMAERPAGM